MSKRKTAAAEAVNLDADPIADTAQDVGEFPPAESSTSENQQSQRKFNPIRSWSERYEGAVRFQVLTDSRVNKIIIKFKLADGQKTPPDEALAIMRAAKVHGDGSPTGLRFEDSRVHGKVWTLPNDAEARATLAGIETRLEELGAKAVPAQAQAV